MVTFCCIVPTFKITINGTEIEITEGKYPYDWIWELDVDSDGLSISVTKTVYFTLKPCKESEITITFDGEHCGWSDHFDYKGPREYLTFGYKNGQWNIMEADFEG